LTLILIFGSIAFAVAAATIAIARTNRIVFVIFIIALSFDLCLTSSSRSVAQVDAGLVQLLARLFEGFVRDAERDLELMLGTFDLLPLVACSGLPSDEETCQQCRCNGSACPDCPTCPEPPPTGHLDDLRSGGRRYLNCSRHDPVRKAIRRGNWA
jgi:hypothetical protein